jgi:hypothetical protein
VVDECLSKVAKFGKISSRGVFVVDECLSKVAKFGKTQLHILVYIFLCPGICSPSDRIDPSSSPR